MVLIKLIKNESKYKSIKETEPLDAYHLVKTHKELYCRICNVYDCYHGIQKSDTFIALNQESNCDIRKAEVFWSDFEVADNYVKENGDVTMHEILSNNETLDVYTSRKVEFKCSNYCFMERKYSEIQKAYVFLF